MIDLAIEWITARQLVIQIGNDLFKLPVGSPLCRGYTGKYLCVALRMLARIIARQCDLEIFSRLV